MDLEDALNGQLKQGSIYEIVNILLRSSSITLLTADGEFRRHFGEDGFTDDELCA